MKWLRVYGWMDDIGMGSWEERAVERVAWRAYRRGVADTKKKYGIIKRSVPQEHL